MRLPASARALTTLTLLGVASAAGAHLSPGRPFDRANLVQSFGAGRRLSFRGQWVGEVGGVDPRTTGMVVRFVTEPQGVRIILLPSEDWRVARGTYRFRQRVSGVRTRAKLRLTARGGRFILASHDQVEPLIAQNTTGIAVGIGAGDMRWCAQVGEDEIHGTPRRLTARSATAATSCPCDELPPDTFEAIQRRVFDRHACTTAGCHGSIPAAADMLLSGPEAYANLVLVASMADSAVSRVAPGDPDRSMLWSKVAARTLGLPNVPGSEMPIGDPAVGAAELEAIRQWILAGAPETGTVASAQELLACDVP